MAKRLTSKNVAKYLGEVDADKYFYLCNGMELRTVYDLKHALADMNDETFMFHRNNSKNDFYNWIRDVVADSKLANDVARAKTLSTTIKKVDARIKELEKIKG